MTDRALVLSYSQSTIQCSQLLQKDILKHTELCIGRMISYVGLTLKYTSHTKVNKKAEVSANLTGLGGMEENAVLLCQRPPWTKQDLASRGLIQEGRKSNVAILFSTNSCLLASSPPARTLLPTVLPLLTILIAVTFLVKNLQRMMRGTHCVAFHQDVLRCLWVWGTVRSVFPLSCINRKQE